MIRQNTWMLLWKHISKTSAIMHKMTGCCFYQWHNWWFQIMIQPQQIWVCSFLIMNTIWRSLSVRTSLTTCMPKSMKDIAESIAVKMKRALELAQADLAAIQQCQKECANQHQNITSVYQWQSGAKIWLDLHDIQTDFLNKKLDVWHVKYTVLKQGVLMHIVWTHLLASTLCFMLISFILLKRTLFQVSTMMTINCLQSWLKMRKNDWLKGFWSIMSYVGAEDIIINIWLNGWITNAQSGLTHTCCKRTSCLMNLNTKREDKFSKACRVVSTSHSQIVFFYLKL